MKVVGLERSCDEEAEVWTPRTYRLNYPIRARIPVPTFSVFISLEDLERDAAIVARHKRSDARDVVRAAAYAIDAAAVAAAAVSAVADISELVGKKRALPFDPVVAPIVDIPNVD
jgi:hypothetical protein